MGTSGKAKEKPPVRSVALDSPALAEVSPRMKTNRVAPVVTSSPLTTTSKKPGDE